MEDYRFQDADGEAIDASSSFWDSVSGHSSLDVSISPSICRYLQRSRSSRSRYSRHVGTFLLHASNG